MDKVASAMIVSSKECFSFSILKAANKYILLFFNCIEPEQSFIIPANILLRRRSEAEPVNFDGVPPNRIWAEFRGDERGVPSDASTEEPT